MVQGIPCLHIEVSSEQRNEEDKSRMLIQASCLVRTINEHQDPADKSTFVDVCIYIDNQLIASRYLVYQPNAEKPEVTCLFHVVFLY